MFHRVGCWGSHWPHGPRRPLQALGFAAGGCREPSGRTGLGHLEPGHIFTGRCGGSGPPQCHMPSPKMSDPVALLIRSETRAGSRTCCTALARSARTASRPAASFSGPASRPFMTGHAWIWQELTRKKTVPMEHWAGYNRPNVPSGSAAAHHTGHTGHDGPFRLLGFAAGGCREPSGKTALARIS